MKKIRAIIAAIRARFNMLLLGLFPFADQIVAFVMANLPAFADYIPANVYKWVGFIVVLYATIRDEIKKRAAPKVAP